MDQILHKTKNTFTFINDILIVTKGTKEEHLKQIEDVIKVLDEAKVLLKLEKCQIAKKNTEKLGYKLLEEGIKPIEEKVRAITDKLKPKNLKDLRSFMGAINQMNRFIPNLANLCAQLRPLLKKDNERNWQEKDEKAFKEIKQAIKDITEIKHFKRNLPLRIICDASKESLGAILQQQNEGEWETTHYASRFSTEFEKKYSINELELLVVVWAIEKFRNCVYGTEFEVVSDHKALTTILKVNRSNKTFSSRLTRWVDRLLPFQFKVVHVPGRTMGMADYLSRHPSESNNNKNKIEAEELWHNWFTVNQIMKTDNIVSEVQKPQQKQNQPLGAKFASASDKQGNHTLASENEAAKANKQPLKQIAANIQTSQLSESTSAAHESAKMSNELMRLADQPPIKKPICYSVNQIEVLQTLGNFTFASRYESDEFLQKIILLIKKPDSTKINRLPTPWRKKFRCLSLDQHDFLYMDERLVIPKTIRPIIMRSLHYGHPGRDVILVTVSNVWWRMLHREVIAIARSCPQCRESGENKKLY